MRNGLSRRHLSIVYLSSDLRSLRRYTIASAQHHVHSTSSVSFQVRTGNRFYSTQRSPDFNVTNPTNYILSTNKTAGGYHASLRYKRAQEMTSCSYLNTCRGSALNMPPPPPVAPQHFVTSADGKLTLLRYFKHNMQFVSFLNIKTSTTEVQSTTPFQLHCKNRASADGCDAILRYLHEE